MSDNLLHEIPTAPAGSLVLTKRQLAEIQLAIYYKERLNHGTSGHNQLILLATIGQYLGFTIGPDGELELPSEMVVYKADKANENS